MVGFWAVGFQSTCRLLVTFGELRGPGGMDLDASLTSKLLTDDPQPGFRVALDREVGVGPTPPPQGLNPCLKGSKLLELPFSAQKKNKNTCPLSAKRARET